jgi:peptidyl-prolyl cis-trans isomerase B (cyclophilin B)
MQGQPGFIENRLINSIGKAWLISSNVLIVLLLLSSPAFGQGQATSPAETAKKANSRPTVTSESPPEPFDGVPVEKLSGQCVTLDTEAGLITIEVMPEVAPEASRNFLNLAATGDLDTTTFSRVLKGFVIQGGNLFTSERWGPELAKRMSHHLPDEPNDVKHVRGIVSMARTNEPNSASTHFFILVGDGHHLDGNFTAFGRVIKGIEVADTINHAEVEGETPKKPVRIKRASAASCRQ